MTQTFTKVMQDAADQAKNLIPQVSFNKNGYEIRTQMLEMAKDLAMFEYSSKFQGWEMTAERDKQTGQIVTKVGFPEVPGLDQVLETAQKLYDFVNQNNIKK